MAEITPLNVIIPDSYVGPNLQAAVNQATGVSPQTTKAAVWIPATYAGIDTYSNPSNIPVFDMRGTGSTPTLGCQSGCSYVLGTPDLPWVPAGGNTSALSSANQGAFSRFYNNATRSVSKVCLQVTTASAGGNLDVGVYSVSGSTGTLVWHSGALSTTSTGVQCATSPTAVLSPNQNYYIGWMADNTTVTMASATGTAGNVDVILGGIGAANTYGLNATDVGTGGVLPGTITITNITNSTTKLLIPWLQVFN